MTDAVNGNGWRFEMPRFNGPAACAETDPEAFFPEAGFRPVEAKRVCNGCQVRDECLAWALEHDEAGVWGGTTEHERRRIRPPRNPGPKMQDINHGTIGGYRAHHRRGEKACFDCQQVESRRKKDWTRRQGEAS